jgi:tetratricopeptide (TPR) repeat protein
MIRLRQPAIAGQRPTMHLLRANATRISELLLCITVFAVSALSQTPPSNPPAPAATPPAPPAANAAPPGAASRDATPESPKATAPAQSTGIKMTLPPPLSPVLFQAREMYRVGKFDEAIAGYNTAIAAAGPDVPGAYAGLARVYLKQRKPDDAFAAAQKSVALDPHLAAAHTALGEVYFRQGKMIDAEREFQTPLKEKIADARAFLGLSRIAHAASNYKTSKVTLDQAHVLDPGDPDIRRAWLATLNLKDRIKAIEDFLGARTNDDKEDLENLQHLQTVLQDEQNRPAHGCQLETKISTTQTDLEQLHTDARSIRGYGLKVKINGVTSRLRLDTGAGGVLVNSSIAEKAGVQRVTEQKIGGIGDKGLAGGYVAFAQSIQIGELEFQNCYVDVVEKSSSMGEDGLIGSDVFAQFLVNINFPDEKFKLSELPKLPNESAEVAALDTGSAANYHPHDRYIAPEMASYTRIFRFGHLLLIPTSVNEHPPKLFLIDTGAYDNTISPAAARESTKIYSEERMVVRGLNGRVRDVYRADDVSLAFAHFVQRKSLLAFDLTNVSDSAGTEISGTLGFGMLYLLNIKIDYRDGLVDFSFEPNRFH